jgi:hypothetical protein
MEALTEKIRTSRTITNEYIAEFNAIGYQVELHYNEFNQTYFAVMSEKGISLHGKGIGMTAIVALDGAYEDLLSKMSLRGRGKF